MSVCKVVGTILYNFGDQTSIAGLNYAFHRKAYVKKIYWSTIFIGFLALTIYAVITNLSNYYQYETITSTDLERQVSIIFPAVSICNHNKVHCTNLFEERQVQINLLEEIERNGSSIKDIKDRNKTIFILEKLFVASGCKQQICEQCNIAQVDPKDFDIENYNCMRALLKIQ